MSDELLRQIADTLGDVVGRLERLERKQDRFEQKQDRFEQKQHQFEQKQNSFEQKLDQLELRMERVEHKVDRIEHKLDATFEQVAKNTEHEVAFNELASVVAEHTTDIRLLKKVVAAS